MVSFDFKNSNDSEKSEIYDRFRFMFTSVLYILLHLANTRLCIDCPVEIYKITVIHFGFMLPNLKGY